MTDVNVSQCEHCYFVRDTSVELCPSWACRNDKPTKKRKKTMTNYSTAVMLFNDNIRAIKCAYEPGSGNRDTVFKTLDKTIEVDDLVIVPTGTRAGMTVVKVVEVDYDIDIEDDTQVDFIVGKVHIKAYDQILELEQKWISALKAGEKQRKRDELEGSMRGLYASSGIDSLEIANMTGEYSDPELRIAPPPAPPPAPKSEE